MAAVSPFDVVMYNNVIFPPESIVTISSRFMSDQAQRTVVYTIHTITVDTVIAESANRQPPFTNEGFTLPLIRRRLSKYGKALRVTNTGFGNLSVNDQALGPQRDVRWGPKPQLMSWEPLGTKAAKIRWSCEVAIIECDPEGDQPGETTSVGLITHGGEDPYEDPEEEESDGGSLSQTGVSGGPLSQTSQGGQVELTTKTKRFGEDRQQGSGGNTTGGRRSGGVAAKAAAAAAQAAEAKGLPNDQVQQAAQGAANQAQNAGGVAGGGAANKNRVLAYNFTVNTSVDEQGYTTRTVSGYIEIPMTRIAGGREMPDNADLYWRPPYVPAPPHGFRRVSQQRSLSEDKRRLNFSVTDSEFNHEIYPEGVLECRASHSAQTVSGDGGRIALLRYTSTIRASYTLNKDIDKRWAMYHFFQLIRHRLIQQKRGKRDQKGKVIHKGMSAFLPLSLSLEEPDIYGRQAASFSFTYLYMVPPTIIDAKAKGPQPRTLFDSLENVGNVSGLWTGDGLHGGNRDNKYNAWAKQARLVESPHGNAGLVQSKTDDWIVDFCRDGVRTAGKKTAFQITAPEYNPVKLNINVARDTGEYIHVDFVLSIKKETGEVVSKKLLSAETSTGSSVTSVIYGVLSGLLGGAGAGVKTHEYSQRTVTTIKATLFYNIIRIGKAPAVPALLSVGDVKKDKIAPLQGNNGGAAGENVLNEVGEHFGVKTFQLSGVQRYVLLATPNQVPDVPDSFDLLYYGKVGQGTLLDPSILPTD